VRFTPLLLLASGKCAVDAVALFDAMEVRCAGAK